MCVVCCACVLGWFLCSWIVVGCFASSLLSIDWDNIRGPFCSCRAWTASSFSSNEMRGWCALCVRYGFDDVDVWGTYVFERETWLRWRGPLVHVVGQVRMSAISANVGRFRCCLFGATQADLLCIPSTLSRLSRFLPPSEFLNIYLLGGRLGWAKSGSTC